MMVKVINMQIVLLRMVERGCIVSDIEIKLENGTEQTDQDLSYPQINFYFVCYGCFYKTYSELLKVV